MPRAGLENEPNVKRIVIALPTRDKGTDLIHVTVGEPGWVPSDEELDAVADMFISAIQGDKTSVVATRTGIRARVLHLKAT